MITLNAIRSASGSAAYTRGSQLHKNENVIQYKIEETQTSIQVEAKVQGSGWNQYKVGIDYNKGSNQIDDYQCECQAFYTYSGMCKHCVAVALELYYEKTGQVNQKLSLSFPNAFQKPEPSAAVSGEIGKRNIQAKATDQVLTNIIYASSMKEQARYLQPELTGQVELVPAFEKQDKKWTVEFKIGAAHKYVVKNVSRLVEAVQSNDWVEYGKKLAFYHEWSVFTKESKNLLGLIAQYIIHEKEVMNAYYSHYGYSYYHYVESLTKRKLSLSGEWMVRLAQELKGGTFQASGIGNLQNLTFAEGNPVLKVAIKTRTDGGYDLTVPAAEVFFGQERLCIRTGCTIYVCSQDFSENIRAVAGLFQGKEKKYTIHPKDASSFCAFVLPVLKQCTNCKATEELEQYEPKPCQISVYLDRQNQAVTAKAVCSYGENQYNIMETITVSEMHRDFEKEYGLAAILKSLFPLSDPAQGLYILPEEDEDKVYGLICEGIPLLQQKGEVFVSDSLKRIRIVEAPNIQVGITMKAGLLEVDLKTEQIPLEEIEGILQGYRRKRKFYRLPDGTFLRLEDGGLSAVAEMAEGLELNGNQLTDGRLTIPGYRSFYLDQVLRENGSNIRINRSQAFKALLREIKNVEDSDFEEPEGLKVELRPYQRFGYRWMMTLQKLGFGGILADDMGLGKTVQAITYLLAQKERQQNKKKESDISSIERNGEEPNPGNNKAPKGRNELKRQYLGLVVCPASLVYNWESEIHRFAPSLSAVTVTGVADGRKEKIEKGEGDILLTSYDLLKRDVEFYQNVQFETVIIDEAQNIKNDTTQAAKSVKALNSIQRFALTGTPIENSLSELWSIFDFLMPGILNTNRKFREHYEQPILSNQDERVSNRLKKMIRPYILRRIKSDVLKELPDKIEKVLFSRMGKEQKKLYDANLQNLLYSLKNQSQEEFRTGKLQILAELTKLRQLCCDPALVYENYHGGAAKMETCMELIRNWRAAGNQMLLFSQFTSALAIIGSALEKEKIPYYMLTGSTSKEKRTELVAAFNQDKTPVFLISLKAGGTGLNLTAASMVIHFDPWWNMAAQNQATDRAHRIGQKQVVTVYKLLMKDTLEEKIQKLQERKAKLSDDLISDGSIKDTLATKEELLEILQR